MRTIPWKARKNAKVEKTEHWVIGYFKKNPIICTSSSLTLIGLMLIFAYHTHIEYAPAFDLKSLASVVFLSAYVGLSLFVACSIVIFVPAIIIGAWFIPATEKNADDVVSRIGKFFSMASLGFGGLFLFVFLSVTYHKSANWLFAFVALCLVVYLAWPKKVFSKLGSYIRQARATERSGSWFLPRAWSFVAAVLAPWFKENAVVLKTATSMAFVCLLQILPLQTFLIFMRDAPGFEDAITWSIAQQVLFVGLIIQVIGAYVVAAWRYAGMRPVHKVYSVMVCLCTPVLVTFFGGNAPFLPASIAHILKIGNFATIEITLTPAGCAIVADQTDDPCAKDPAKKNKIYGAYVMSRLGAETYLKIAGTNPRKAENKMFSRDICIPSKEIIGLEMDLSKRHYNVRAIDKSFQPKT